MVAVRSFVPCLCSQRHHIVANQLRAGPGRIGDVRVRST